MQKGDRVRIIDGPFKGSEGVLRTIVDQTKGPIYFVLPDGRKYITPYYKEELEKIDADH